MGNSTSTKFSRIWIRRFLGITVLGIIISLSLSSCFSNKKLSYFRDAPDTTFQEVVTRVPKEPHIIRKNDILRVTVHTMDIVGGNLMTAERIGRMGSDEDPSSNGFMVDEQGNIELPLIGKVKAEGKTIEQLTEEIRKKEELYYKDPIVNVRLINFTVSILGEVRKPGQYIIQNEKASILDAITLAGDLTPYGIRDNVLLVRNEGGRQVYARFNLRSKDIFENPNFYLKQGDLIYVQPNKSGAAAADVNKTRNVSVIVSVLTLAILLFNRVDASLR